MRFLARLLRFIFATAFQFILNFLLLGAVNLLTHLFHGRELLWISLAIAAGDGLVSACWSGDVPKPKRLSPYNALCGDGRWKFSTALAAVCAGHLALFVGGFGGLMLLYIAHLIPFAAIPWSLGTVAGIQILTVMALLAEHIYWGRAKLDSQPR